VGQGAILIVDSVPEGNESLISIGSGCLEGVEIAGKTTLERSIERLVAIDLEKITIVLAAGVDSSAFRFPAMSNPIIGVPAAVDVPGAVAKTLRSYADDGIQHSFISWACDYVETDLLDLLCFHRESRQAVTSTCNREGNLRLWAVDCAKCCDSDAISRLGDPIETSGSRYFVREYVMRLRSPQDLRRLAADIVRRKCETIPGGRQVRPGVWLDEGAKVHRRSRIVAPCYIGRNAQIDADALITRFTDIERDCRIQSGTVIDNSSILEGTIVGICLDVCHSVASGNTLINVERGVVIEIADSRILRANPRVRTEGDRVPQYRGAEHPDPVNSNPVSNPWQLENA
jgi:NDP-sugar pyrophosphorylase family protein